MKSDFTSAELRSSLALFATGIAIATTSDGNERAGITVNSFSSVSMTPPLVLFSLNRNLRSFALFERASGFSINVLRHDQRAMSEQFSRGGESKWNDVDWETGKHGGIIIRPSLASFDCRLRHCYDGGDHAIFVGEVVALSSESVHEPLIYFRSRYHDLPAPRHASEAA